MPPITYRPNFISEAQGQLLLEETKGYPFVRPKIKVFGRWHLVPRQQVWFADPGCDYRYSSLMIKAQPWPPLLKQLRVLLQQQFTTQFNGVLVNCYQGGCDTMGWHSDNEREIVQGSQIASVSLGGSRDFLMRHKVAKQVHKLTLNHGDLLMMHAPMQQDWQHSVPKRARMNDLRINLTFRLLTPYFHHHD
nr:alpha-ketoglutarate-dependent dioxygenase AlkB [Shewanella gelidii]